MPIKSCSVCGLKVLVDAAAAAADNYVCPRCSPEGKAASAPKPAGGGKRPSVKVTCPYCGASFSGSKPSRPAKGGCPVCQKELVLLPDGTIQAAATFNLSTWQKERKSASNPPPAAPAPAPEAPPEMPEAHDPLGGSTILDMGGPPGGAPPAPLPSLDEPTMAMPGGLGGETMLGMGSGAPEAPPMPEPTIEESAPPPDSGGDEPTDIPPDLGGATILDMGPRPVELPPPDIDEPPPKPDLLSETMPGMDRPPSEESPVAPPTPPPIPEEPAALPEPEESEVPTIRDEEVSRPEEPPVPTEVEETYPESTESAPELPVEMGGQTILDMGGAGDMGTRPPEPAPSIEEPPPEAVPILAKDVDPVDELPEAPAEPEPAEGVKGYVYQPIARSPRKPAAIDPPTPAPAPHRPAPARPAAPPPPPAANAPVLGSDFRIAAAPPAPKPAEKAVEERRPAGPRTTAAIMPRAQHGMAKMVMAWVLLALPAGAGFALYSMQKTPTVEKVIQRFANEMLPGIKKMDAEIRKSATKPPEPPPETK